MGDQLEQFILQNREAFDNQEPSDQVWENINRKANRRNDSLSIAWKVAAMLFLASTLFLLIDRNKSLSNEGPVLSAEFMEAEKYYTQLIIEKKQEIYENLNPEMESEFLEEINELDEMYEELKKTYQVNAANERVLEALISNLQLRLELLNRQLEILSAIKNIENEDKTTIDA